MTVYELIQKLAENKPDGKVHIKVSNPETGEIIDAEIVNILTIAWHGKDIEIIAEQQ